MAGLVNAYTGITAGRLARKIPMQQRAHAQPRHLGLLNTVICPNCWQSFPPEDVLFIAEHDSLVGDQIAGPTSYLRFRPTRFNVAGEALDPSGTACHQLACPRCHLSISRPTVEMRPFFVSIVGAPGSGKSYFLAAMTWTLRSQGPQLGFTVTDGDPIANHELQRYEESLFMTATPDEPVALRKTEIQSAELYQSVMQNGQSKQFPRPFQFTLGPAAHGTSPEEFPYRSLIMYDNAGEHFMPGQATSGSPVTMHLAQSAAILFVFDPTQDARFRAICRKDDPQLSRGIREGASHTLSRQEVVLNEMIARIRRYRGLSQGERHNRPLVVVVAKADAWLDAAEHGDDPISAGEPASLDLARVEATSVKVRDLLARYCPETVHAAEAFSSKVVYVPVSSLGRSPELVSREGSSFLGIRPRLIEPRWVTTPLLLALHANVPNLVSAVKDGIGSTP